MADVSSSQDFSDNAVLRSPVWKALFEALEDGCCLLSQDARIVAANLTFAEMVDLPLAQLRGRTCAEVFSQRPEISQLATFLMESCLTGHVASKEFHGRQPGQRLLVRVVPVREEQEQITASVVIVREISDISVREREIARVEQKARFGELAAGLAHEIKNPLAGIQGAVDILLSRRESNDPDRGVLEGVRHEVGRIDNAVQILLDRARPRTVNIHSASINEVVERAVGFAQATLTTVRKDQIRFDLEPSPAPIMMLIDAVQIEDAVLNLLLNAIEAIDGGGVIKARVYETAPDIEAGDVVIEITDSGRGIAPEALPRIFSPFYTTHPAGTGLGLSAVRGIAKAHGGRVDVSSEVRIGSTFSLRLPHKPLGMRFPIVN